MAVEDSWYTLDRSTGQKIKTKRHGRGKRWRVRNRGARTMSFDRKTEAETYDVKVRGELQQGITPFDHRAGRITFAEYAARWLAEHHYTGRSRETVATRINVHLVPTFGEMQMSRIRHSTVKSWLANLRTTPSKLTKRPLAASTIARVYDALAGIMSSALKDKVIAVNPLDGIDYPTVPKGRRVLTVWEHATVNALLGAVPDREHAVPLLAATCGHRQSEAFALAVEDIDFLRHKTITIRHQVQRVEGRLTLVPPKGQKTRTVPLPKVTADALSAHIERYGTTPVRCECCERVSRILFVSDGKIVTPARWNEANWHPAVTSADMVPSRSTGLHQLRHYYASMLIDGGANPKQVQEYMGHASITITMNIYGHLFEQSHDRARSIVDTAFSAGVYPLRTAEVR